MTSPVPTINEIDDVILKLESLRTSYRHLHNQLLSDAVEDESMDSYQPTIDKVKSLIISAKSMKCRLASDEFNVTKIAMMKTIEFSIKNVNQSIRHLESKFAVDFKKSTDT